MIGIGRRGMTVLVIRPMKKTRMKEALPDLCVSEEMGELMRSEGGEVEKSLTP